MNESDTITPAQFKEVFGHDIHNWHAYAHSKFDKAMLALCELHLYVDAVRAATADHGTRTPGHRIADHYLSVAEVRLRAAVEAMGDVRFALSRHIGDLDREDLHVKKTDHLESFLKGQGWFE